MRNALGRAGAGTSPKVGLRPTTPQNAAGTRIDPAPSDPSAAATMPAATAAALPPELPPALRRPGAKGVLVGPKARLSVVARWPSSGTLVVPTITAPAACSRSTSSEGAVTGPRATAPQPRRTGVPGTRSPRSFTATGTPSSGPRPRAPRPAVGGQAGLGPGGVGPHVGEGPDLAVERRDAAQRRVEQLDRRHRAPVEGGGQGGHRPPARGQLAGTPATPASPGAAAPAPAAPRRPPWGRGGALGASMAIVSPP